MKNEKKYEMLRCHRYAVNIIMLLYIIIAVCFVDPNEYSKTV